MGNRGGRYTSVKISAGSDWLGLRLVNKNDGTSCTFKIKSTSIIGEEDRVITYRMTLGDKEYKIRDNDDPADQSAKANQYDETIIACYQQLKSTCYKYHENRTRSSSQLENPDVPRDYCRTVSLEKINILEPFKRLQEAFNQAWNKKNKPKKAGGGVRPRLFGSHGESGGQKVKQMQAEVAAAPAAGLGAQ